jgi:hypothetical protein
MKMMLQEFLLELYKTKNKKKKESILELYDSNGSWML